MNIYDSLLDIFDLKRQRLFRLKKKITCAEFDNIMNNVKCVRHAPLYIINYIPT